jgi:putative transposase
VGVGTVRGVMVTQAYRFALDPTSAQRRALYSHAGAARFAWNWGLAACRDRYDAEGKWWSGVDLHRLWNAVKKSDPALAWWGENGTARILSATVSRTAHRWYVSFTVQVDRSVPERHPRPGSLVGVDLGVETLLTGVDERGVVIEIEGPKALTVGLRKLRRLNRAHCRKQRGSANRAKAAARLARHHALVVADRWFPSSKTCSGCGGRKPNLTLAERTYRCHTCGLSLGRDVNAAINLRDLAASGAESQNACGGDVRPGPAGQTPAKQEPGTARADQTGTAAAQATAA